MIYLCVNRPETDPSCVCKCGRCLCVTHKLAEVRLYILMEEHRVIQSIVLIQDSNYVQQVIG